MVSETPPAARSSQAGAFEWFIPEGRVIWSPDLEALYGLPRGSFEGRLDGWERRTVADDLVRVHEQLRLAMDARQETVTYDFRLILPDGTPRWVAGQATLTYDDAGRPLRMAGITVDIDDRKRTEARDQFLLKLEDHVRPLVDPDEIAAVTTRLLGEHLDVDRCFYADIGDDQDTLTPTSHYIRDPSIPAFNSGSKRSAFGAVRDGSGAPVQPSVVADIEAEGLSPDHLGAFHAAQVRAFISVPLVNAGKLVATMSAHMARTPRQWRHDEVELMRVVANRCWESIERGRIGRTLRETHARLETALSAGDVATWTLDIDRDLIVADANFARLFDVPHVEAQPRAGAEYLSRIHPGDLIAVREVLARDIAGGAREHHSEYRVIHGNGSVHWLVSRGRLDRDASGRAVRIKGVVVDVSERKRAEQAVADSAAHFRLLADTLPQLAWIAQDDGNIYWYNRRWYEYTGTTLETMRGTGWTTVHDPEVLPRVLELWNTSIVTGEPFEMEFPLRGTDGRFRAFLTRVEPLRDAAGRVTQWFGTNTDVEEKRRALEAERAARVEAERVARMKDEFLSTLSHELRTPLNAILGWSQLLRRGHLGQTEQVHAVETIERNARAQARMVEDLLDMSRIVSGKVRLDVQRVDLADVVSNAIESVRPAADARGVRIERILDPLAGPVSGDPGRLQQVVWNLLSNAIKFTASGGKVQVVLERVNSHLELAVSDTGVGIRPDFLPFVFDRFRQADSSTTRQFGGLGMGLSIVKQLAELHGGSVRAKSPGEGAGATFTVALPLAAARHEPDAGRVHPRTSNNPNDEADVPTLEGLRVLVVDDEADARTLVARILQDRGATTITAADARQAMHALEAERPDILLSDIGMPDVDGYDLIRSCRALGEARGGGVPAVALTAFARSEDRRRALLAGFQTHVAKPVDAAELVAVVASLTGRTGPRQ